MASTATQGVDTNAGVDGIDLDVERFVVERYAQAAQTIEPGLCFYFVGGHPSERDGG